MLEHAPGPDPAEGNERQADYGRSDGRWKAVPWADLIETTEVDTVLGRTPVKFVDLGEGPPILLVHGLAGSWRNWLENIPALADQHRVVAIDLPGFGESPLPRQPISMSGYGEVVAAVARNLELGPATTLVGHSMGGLVSVEAALGAPESFGQLCLVASAGITNLKTQRRQKEVTRGLMRAFQPFASLKPERGFRRPRLRAARFAGVIAHPDRLDPEILWELAAYGLRAPGLLQAAYALAGHDLRERLGELGQPTLLIWGTRDLLVPVAVGRSFRKRIPDSDLVVLSDTGHMIQMERPLRFNWELTEFVAAQVPEANRRSRPLLEAPTTPPDQTEP